MLLSCQELEEPSGAEEHGGFAQYWTNPVEFSTTAGLLFRRKFFPPQGAHFFAPVVSLLRLACEPAV